MIPINKLYSAKLAEILFSYGFRYKASNIIDDDQNRIWIIIIIISFRSTLVPFRFYFVCVCVCACFDSQQIYFIYEWFSLFLLLQSETLLTNRLLSLLSRNFWQSILRCLYSIHIVAMSVMWQTINLELENDDDLFLCDFSHTMWMM